MHGLGFLELYTAGLANTFQPDVLLFSLIGTATGLIFGAIPGLSATIGVAILTPLTFSMKTEPSFALLLGVYCGSIYGGSISAILINVPGTIAAIMTTLDGYQMCKKGEAGLAIGLATTASFIGGVISALALAFLAPPIAEFAIHLSAQEYFAVCLFGISVIVYISGDSLLKGGISAALGLLLATIGLDPTTAYARFTFGSTDLLGGVNLIALMVGMFGLAEVMRLAEGEAVVLKNIATVDRVVPKLRELWDLRYTLLRGSVIGVFIGAVPATGGSIAAIVTYGLEKRISRHPETFGRGEHRGIVGPESANNASTGGCMIPMMTLGIPGDIVTAILIGALILHGLRPGPILFRDNPAVVSSIFLLMLISNFIFLFLGLFAARYFAKLITLPRYALITMILCLATVGTYSIENSLFDVWILLVGGVAGYVMTKIGIPVTPLILGFTLGPLLESYLRQGLILSYGNPIDFFSRPISATFFALTVLVFVSPYFVRMFAERGKKKELA
jgi:putative tricarboxylic transport membrane protein